MRTHHLVMLAFLFLAPTTAVADATSAVPAGCNSYGCYEDGGGCNSYGCYRRGGGCNSYGCWERGGGCNSYGCWRNGGGCNSYGCWHSPEGSCNSYGCTNNGRCTSHGCPPDSRRGRGRRHAAMPELEAFNAALAPELGRDSGAPCVTL